MPSQLKIIRLKLWCRFGEEGRAQVFAIRLDHFRRHIGAETEDGWPARPNVFAVVAARYFGVPAKFGPKLEQPFIEFSMVGAGARAGVAIDRFLDQQVTDFRVAGFIGVCLGFAVSWRFKHIFRERIPGNADGNKQERCRYSTTSYRVYHDQVFRISMDLMLGVPRCL